MGSAYANYKRASMPPQLVQKLEPITFPAPTRGLMLADNEAFQQPGGAVVMDNWKPTLRGCSLRGGCVRWATLPETTPVISAFEYASGNNQQMFAANATKLYNVTGGGSPTLVKSGQTSGNYAASQLANQGGDYLIAVNDAGNDVLRYDGTNWVTLTYTVPTNWATSTFYAVGARATDTADNTHWKVAPTHAHTSAPSGTFLADRSAHPGYWVEDTASDDIPWITGPAGTKVANGKNLVYVNKYRNRLFFIEATSMNAWYLPPNSVGGQLQMIPLSGAATRGGKLLFCATWSLDAGDGVDDKLVFATDLGELLIFTGGDPSSAANWRQEGRYQISPPMGMNAWVQLGGELLILTTSGIIPVSASITKGPEELELAAITRNIREMWRDEVNAKRQWSWTACNWEEYGGAFVTWPGGAPGKRYCAVVNASTGAWCRFVGYDATCFIRMRSDMFFGTQDGKIMQADRSGYDDGVPYLATLVGGWEIFQSPGQTITWRQARASFTATQGQPFQPQLSGTTDYNVTLPQPPPAGDDPDLADVWDQGHWGPGLGPVQPAAWENNTSYTVGQQVYDPGPFNPAVIDENFTTAWPADISPNGLWQKSDWTSVGNDMDPSRAVVADGVLSLTSTTSSTPLQGAEVQTTHGYGYGLYEARMKVSAADAGVSGFFLYGPGGVPEFDIEFLLNEGLIFHVTNHPETGETIVPIFFDPTAAFHTYGINWIPGPTAGVATVQNFVDGVMVATQTSPNFLAPPAGCLIMMNAWSGNPGFGGGPPSTNATTQYDWVRFTPYVSPSIPNNSLWPLWTVATNHTSAPTGLFALDRANNPTYWTAAGTYPPPPVPTAPERAQYAQWDQKYASRGPVRNTMWVSIGVTGYSHAPIVQVMVAQTAKPNVDLIAISALFERAGMNV